MSVKHAPGWKWRKDYAGQLDQPWPADLPAHVGGLCESGWCGDCPQRPLDGLATNGQCACTCHRNGQGVRQ